MRLPHFPAFLCHALPNEAQFKQFKICNQTWELKQQDRNRSINLFRHMSCSIYLSSSVSLIFLLSIFLAFLFHSVYPLHYNTFASPNAVEASHGNSANMCGVHIAWETRRAYTVGSRDGMMSGFSGRGPKGVPSDSVGYHHKNLQCKVCELISFEQQIISIHWPQDCKLLRLLVLNDGFLYVMCLTILPFCHSPLQKGSLHL